MRDIMQALSAKMASALDVFTRFVNSPGGVLTAGAVLAGIVWKFFERVEAVLTEQTKLEIARWLRVTSFSSGIITDAAATWPRTFAAMFDRLFGKKHLSWNFFFAPVLHRTSRWVYASSSTT
jgi:hypothetical protein